MSSQTASARRRPAVPCERGSVLLLMPAAALIVIVLAAIAVDLSLVRIRHEQLENVAAAAANDAANQLDQSALRAGGDPSTPTVVLDPERVATVVAETVEAQGLGGVSIVRADVDGREVVVTLSIEVEHLFGRALPGTPDHRRVTASGSATLLLTA